MVLGQYEAVVEQLWQDMGWWLPALVTLLCAAYLFLTHALLDRIDQRHEQACGYRFFRLSVTWPWLLLVVLFLAAPWIDWFAISIPVRLLIELITGRFDAVQWQDWLLAVDAPTASRMVALVLDRLLVLVVGLSMVLATVLPVAFSIRSVGLGQGLSGTLPQLLLYLPFALVSLAVSVPLLILSSAVNVFFGANWRPALLLRW